MNREVIFAKVTTSMADLFDLDAAAISPTTTFEDLKLTSLDAIDLVVELQRITGRRVAEDGLRKIRTVGDIVDLIERHLAADPGGAAPAP